MFAVYFKRFLFLFFALIPFFVQAQELEVTISLNSAGENRFSVCDGERKIKIRVENITGSSIGATTLTDVVAALDLTNANGLAFTGTINMLSGGAVTVNNASIPSFNLPQLNDEEFVEFEIGMEALCAAKALAGGGSNPNFDINFTFTGGDGEQTQNSGNFEVVKPALSIPTVAGNVNPLLNTYDAGGGSTDTIDITVVNAGDGPLNHFVYWVKDHLILTCTDVIVGNVSLPIIAVSGDTTFYDITPAAIAFAIPGAGSPTNNAKFQFNEKLIVREVWRTDDCTLPAPDILRGAQYGCAVNPVEYCEVTTKNTGVRFGILRPNLVDALVPALANPWPACYVSTPPSFAAYIANTGLLNATEVRFLLSSWNAESGRELDTAKIYYRIGINGTNQKISPAMTYSGSTSTGLGNVSCYGRNAIYAADIVLPFDLKPNDTIYMFWQQSTVCFDCYFDANNPSSCRLGAYGYHLLAHSSGGPSTYKDPCGLQTYNIAYRYSDHYDAYMWNFGEGPAMVFNNQVNTNNYTITDWHNTFYYPQSAFNGQGQSASMTYPRKQFKIIYTLPKGLDWEGDPNDVNSAGFSLVDPQGDKWLPSSIYYQDNQSASGDTLILTFNGDYPPAFSMQNNDYMTLKYRGDCAETGPTCAQGGLVSIGQAILFKPDTTCTDCGYLRIACPQPVDVLLKCPGCCVIPGLQPVDLSIKRVNFESPDNDNNFRPDASGVIDLTKVRQDRFIAGDTIRVQYKGVFTTDATNPDWAHAFSLITLPSDFPATVIPLGGALTIKNGANTYTADILQQVPYGLELVTDLSPQKLIDLGNTGIPNTFTAYQSGDSVILEVLMTVTDNTFEIYTSGISGRPLIITDNSFATTDATWPVAAADRYTCDFLRERVYYIEQKHYLGSDNGSFSGGCTLGRLGYDWEGFYIGSESVDFFPYEFRAPKADLEQTIHTIKPGFKPIAIEWQIYAKGFIGVPYPVGSVPLNSGTYYRPIIYGEGGNVNSGSYYGEVPMTSPYVSVVADSVIFNTGQFIRDNWPNLQADEGYRMFSQVHWQASCATPKTAAYELKNWPKYTFTTKDKVFGYTSFKSGRVAFPPVSGNYDNSNNLLYGYAGGPILTLQTSVTTQEILGESACFEVDITNSADALSKFTWMSLSSPSGAVVVNSIQEVSTTTGNVISSITPSLGIVPLGQLDAAVNGNPALRRFRLCVSTDNCSKDSIQVSTGWQCDGYPATIEESGCAKPQTVYLVPVGGELGMIIQKPTTSVTSDLCAETEYVVQLSSTILGTIHDINLQFELPDQQDFQTGTFEYAYPAPTSGLYTDVTNWVTCPTQPVNVFGNTWEINTTNQGNPILSVTGLPGTTQIGQNFMFVRFKTKTGCSYMSGSNATFLSWALDACDKPTNFRYSPASAVNITGVVPTYKTNITVGPKTVNPCNNQQTQISITFSIKPGSIPTGNGDSIRVILPPGVTYAPITMVGTQNATTAEPVIENINGQQILYWDVNDGLLPGNTVKFNFMLNTTDAGQLCRAYDLIVQNFGTQSAVCVSGGTTCPIRVLSQENRSNFTFTKPILSVTSFTASAVSNPPTETVNYSITVKNTGAAIQSGASTNIQVYSDVDGDNDVTAADMLLFTATTTAAIPNGGTTIISGTASVTAGNTCKLIALVNPDATCVCSRNESFTATPNLSFTFIKSFTTCSSVPVINIGPATSPNTTYTWTALDGANISALSATTGSPIVFELANTGSAPLVQKYLLRAVRGTGNSACYSLDTVSVLVYPEIHDVANVTVCQGAAFNMAGPTVGSNFLWSPTTNLSDPTNPQTSVAALSADAIYTLNYIDANGCVADFVSNITLTACAATGLGDTVWIDRNYNGIQDPGELPVAGVVVYLYNANNTSTPISSTTTDVNGHYFFQPLSAGNYRVGFELPAGFIYTTSNAGGDDAKDSDVDPLTGLTQAVFIPNGVLDSTLDAGFIVRDWGDAPDSYLTDASGVKGPHHTIIPELYLGTLNDPDVQGYPAITGQPAKGDDLDDATDDEDGVGAFPTLNTLLVGQTVQVTITGFNNTGEDANIVGWLDFNRNGVFDASEGVAIIAPSAGAFTQTISWTVPNDIVGGLTYARFRLTTDPLTSANPAGFADDGEVEDYEVNIDILKDWSDAPDSYDTDNVGVMGANHVIIPGLRLGATIDGENNGMPVVDGTPANGDDLSVSDDEDGVASFPTLITSSTSYQITITATNLTNTAAKTVAWIDFDGNGTFQANEAATVTIPANTNNGSFMLSFSPNPATTEAGLTYARFRLTTDAGVTVNTPAGNASNGEVEDYELTIICPTIVNNGSAASRSVCLNSNPGTFDIITNEKSANSIKFVQFTEPQVDLEMYNGGTTLAVLSPDANGAVTFSATAAQFNVVDTFYVYAIMNPTPGDSINCTLPYQEYKVIVWPLPVPTLSNFTVCPSLTNTLDPGAFASYAWSSGETTQTVTKGAGTYTVTVTDSNGCTASTQAVITEFAAPIPSLSNATVCPSLTTTLNPGAFVSYEWSSGENSQTVTKGAGTYTVTVTNDNGCTASTQAVVSEYPAPTPSLSNVSVCPSLTTTLDPGTFVSYEWSSGENTQTVTKGAGTYTVTVTNDNGCTASTQAVVNESVAPDPSLSNAIVCPSLTSTLDPGTFASYAWSSGENTQTVTKGAGTYTVTVTDSNGCTASTQAIITEYPAPTPSLSNATVCPGLTTTLNPGAFVSYAWSSGENTQTVTKGAGTYTVTVTNDNGCTASTQAVVSEYPAPTPMLSNTTVCPGLTTTLDPGTFVSYEWSSGENSQTVTKGAGTYTVTVTNDNGCTASTQAVVNEFTSPDPSLSNTTVCLSLTTSLDPGAFASYAWSSGENTQTVTKGAGTYTVTVTDSNGCTASTQAVITEYPAPKPSLSNVTVCPSLTTTLDPGSFTSYEWSSGENTQTVTKGAGTYTVTVTDSNGCTASTQAVVSEYPAPTPMLNNITVCPGLTTTLDPGTFVSYEWNSGENTQTVTKGAGTYTVTVTNDNGCTASSQVVVSEYPALTPSLSNTTVCPSLTTTLDPGAFASYEWSSGETTQTVSKGIGTFTVTVTHDNGCTASTQVIIDEFTAPTPTLSNPTVCPSLTTTLDPGTFASYAWSSSETTQTITKGAGTYTVTVTDVNDCSATISATIGEFTPPVVSISGASTICNGDSLTLNATGDGALQWSNAATTQAIKVAPSSTSTYTVTITDLNGCIDTEEAIVNVTPLPDAGADIVIQCPIGDVAPASTYNFAIAGDWEILSQPVGANPVVDANGLVTGLTKSGTYTLRITVNGCADEVNITIPDCCVKTICVPVQVVRN